MTDIAQILGVHDGGSASRPSPAAAVPPPPPQPVNRAAQKVQKASLSREVMHLLSAGDYHTVGGGDAAAGSQRSAGVGLPTAVPTFTSQILGDG